jgi:hypothetical protein
LALDGDALLEDEGFGEAIAGGLLVVSRSVESSIDQPVIPPSTVRTWPVT